MAYKLDVVLLKKNEIEEKCKFWYSIICEQVPRSPNRNDLSELYIVV